MENNPKIKSKEATAIINSLIGGVVPKIGVQHITVGRTDEVATFVKALEDVKNGHSMMKFWIGDFGSGKSFMLHLLNTVALKQKFVVTNADFTPHTRLYSNDEKSRALYTALVNNLAIQTKPEGGALPVLIEKWIEQTMLLIAEKNGISPIKIRRPEHSGTIQNVIMQTINGISDTGGFDFGLAVAKYYEGFIGEDEQMKKNALRWLKGEYTAKREAKTDLGVSDIINDRNYYDMLKNLCRFFTSIGYSGFVINLDETVNLYKIVHAGIRQKNYETLMSIYNDCFQGKVEHIFFNIAGTTEVLEDKDRGFYSYDALKTRLQVNKFETSSARDLAQPVIRLTPLTHNEIFVLLQKLRSIFDLNYETAIDFSDEDIHTFMEEMYNKSGASEFLTPREVIRDFLNILNILRQNPDVTKKQLFEEIVIEDERPASLEAAETAEEEMRKEKSKRIEKQCRSLNLSEEMTDKLINTLLDDENLLKMLTGSLRNQAGSLFATEKRLIFISRQMEITSFLYGQINEMSYTKGLQHSTLHILPDNDRFNIDLIPNAQIKPLISLLEAQIDVLERKTLSAELQYWRKMINNEGIKCSLERMSKIAYIIHEKDHTTGEIFFMRHADTLTKILKQYSVLENAGLTDPEIEASMKRIESSIAVTHQAFEHELGNIFKTDMLDIDAEAEAYMQGLRNRGLIE